MNCQQFDQIIVNLACNVRMDAAERARALAHADTCLKCGARFTRQQTISTALQSLARQEQTINAPARIGQLLFAAFEQQHVVRPALTPVRRRFWAGLHTELGERICRSRAFALCDSGDFVVANAAACARSESA